MTLTPEAEKLRGEVRAFIADERARGVIRPQSDPLLAGLDPGTPLGWAAAVAPGSVEPVRELGALARTVQIAGALGEVLDLCVRYTGERVQFGRPIGKFQAVAHLVARLAAMVTSVEAAAHAAVLARAGRADEPAEGEAARLAVAAAKTQASATAGLGARIAHQVHGTIGFTQEYRLHHLTRRLWSWREEYGCDEHWSAVLGTHVINQGAEELWPTMTRV